MASVTLNPRIVEASNHFDRVRNSYISIGTDPVALGFVKEDNYPAAKSIAEDIGKMSSVVFTIHKGLYEGGDIPSVSDIKIKLERLKGLSEEGNSVYNEYIKPSMDEALGILSTPSRRK